MIIELRDETDLPKMEMAMREMLGARRMDVSVLLSRNYIDFRQALLKHMHGDQMATMKRASFSNETLMLRIIHLDPLTVWIGHKDAELFYEKDSI